MVAPARGAYKMRTWISDLSPRQAGWSATRGGVTSVLPLLTASMAKRALITGITGQDGSYLAELLLAQGYEVAGVTRRSSAPNLWRIQHLLDRIDLRPADLLDQLSLIRVLADVRPTEVYNLAAMSFVPASWDQPMLTGEFNAQGVTRVLEAVRHVDPGIRLYQASSSEMYGKVREVPQTELTPFYPRSPYGVSKVFAHYITVNYRESYNLFAVSGILFNHESPRRGLEFVTRKVTDGVARIKLGLADSLSLGNLDAQRDWGFAGDYVRAMWLMLQQDQPDDYVIATGESHSVRELVEVAFGHAGLEWEKYVRLDPRFLRPAEVDHLIGDSAKARSVLGWTPEVDFAALVRMMVDADLERLGRSPGARAGLEVRGS
jgi:GDPmannose 4,6-dehydratase